MDLKLAEIVITTILSYITGFLQKFVPGLADELIPVINFVAMLGVAYYLAKGDPAETLALAAAGSAAATGVHQGPKQIRALVKRKLKERQARRAYNPRNKKDG